MVKRKHIYKGLAAVLALTVMAGSMLAVNASAVDGSALTISAAVSEALQNNSTLDYKTVGVNKNIKMTAAAKGGSGNYTYAYYYKKESATKWNMKKNFSTTSSLTISFSTTGTYDICIKVKDSKGTVEKKYFTVKVNPELTGKSKVTSKCITLGQTVTLQGAATGGSGGYKYSYLYRLGDKGSWKTLKGFSTTTSVKFTPAAEGDYEICIKAKDSYKTVSSQYFSLSVKELKNNSSLSAETVKLGSTVTMKGAASGGNGSYSFAYLVQSPGSSNWQTLKDFSTAKSCSFKPAKTGTYNVCIKVKDITGTIAKNYMTLTVASKTDAEKITDSLIKSGMTEIEKVKAIHDWLVNNVEYDTEGYQSDNISDESHTAEGLFKNRKAVCDGYSNAFMQMAQYAGFEVIVVEGVGYNSTGVAENHAWNQIKVNGNWYNVDVTWDDPVASGDIGFDNLRYTYFLIPDSVINRDHTSDPDSPKYPCTTAQPKNELIDIVLADDIKNHKNYCTCKSAGDVENVTKSFTDKDVKTFTIIYKISDFETSDIKGDNTAGLIQSLALNAQEEYYSLRSEYMEWKFEGYMQITLNFR